MQPGQHLEVLPHCLGETEARVQYPVLKAGGSCLSAEFPEIGRLCDEYNGSRRIYRALNTRHDRIVYTVSADRVLIVAVFDCRRDPAELTSMLKERDTQNR